MKNILWCKKEIFQTSQPLVYLTAPYVTVVTLLGLNQLVAIDHEMAKDLNAFQDNLERRAAS